jgi:transcriptional regulator with XRE-family HTH domain
VKVDSHAVTVAAGAQLRTMRESLGLTLAATVSRMASDIRVPTLAGYETGIREFSVGRFVEICAAMKVSPLVVLAATLAPTTPGLIELGDGESAADRLGPALARLAEAERAVQAAREAIVGIRR